jgi:serine/threonine protein phosphatase PrpC
VVADGWSSSRAWQDGKTASQLTVNAIVETFSQAESVKVQELWRKGFEAACKNITQYSASKTESNLIQVTCVAALVMNRRLYVASLGHCRAFLLRQQRIQQISVADSLVDKMIERGVVTYEELRKSIIDVRGPTRRLPNDSRPDLRLRLNPNETDEQAEANQGMQLYGATRFFYVTRCIGGMSLPRMPFSFAMYYCATTIHKQQWKNWKP